MPPRSRSIALALLCLSVAACGEQGDQSSGNAGDGLGGGAYAEMLANAATQECRQAASAANAANHGQLQRICDSTHDKIIAAQPVPLEREESRRAKMKDALSACVAEVGGNA